MILFVALTVALVLSLRRASRRRSDALVSGVWEAAAGLAVATFFLQTWVDFSVAWTIWGVAGAALGLSYVPHVTPAPTTAIGASDRYESEELRRSALA